MFLVFEYSRSNFPLGVCVVHDLKAFRRGIFWDIFWKDNYQNHRSLLYLIVNVRQRYLVKPGMKPGDLAYRFAEMQVLNQRAGFPLPIVATYGYDNNVHVIKVLDQSISHERRTQIARQVLDVLKQRDAQLVFLVEIESKDFIERWVVRFGE